MSMKPLDAINSFKNANNPGTFGIDQNGNQFGGNLNYTNISKDALIPNNGPIRDYHGYTPDMNVGYSSYGSSKSNDFQHQNQNQNMNQFDNRLNDRQMSSSNNDRSRELAQEHPSVNKLNNGVPNVGQMQQSIQENVQQSDQEIPMIRQHVLHLIEVNDELSKIFIENPEGLDTLLQNKTEMLNLINKYRGKNTTADVQNHIEEIKPIETKIDENFKDVLPDGGANKKEGYDDRSYIINMFVFPIVLTLILFMIFYWDDVINTFLNSNLSSKLQYGQTNNIIKCLIFLGIYIGLEYIFTLFN